MKKKFFAWFAIGLLVFVLAGPAAWSTPFTATLPDNLGPLNGGVLNYSVISPGASLPGDATLAFDLLGYASVDGANCCTDTFSLFINNDLMFKGGFNMGGGGSNFINFIAPGVTILSSTSYGLFRGGLTQFSVNHSLVSGTNNYVFDYGVMQGLGDEGWGLRSAVISADINDSSSPVPEPSTMLLLCTGIAGFAGIRLGRRK
ncbi:MAG: hypothetical protein A2277_00225 [Desulfobacterales bacterium RIFOXYA12_FULL_46_15]|nr:MAG: hypothetical protein A2277_00225 [Desulfobacterales bacterium RIFOXYA12_FULL_46_15]